MSREQLSSLLKKLLLLLLTLLIAGLIATLAVVDPKLVTYQSNSKHVTNLYWLDLDGNAHLSDTNESFVRLDESTQNLHICHSFSTAENCQVYKVIDTTGSFTVLGYLIQQQLLD